MKIIINGKLYDTETAKEIGLRVHGEDPRDSLVERILEYKKYKYMAAELRDKSGDAGEIVIRPQSLPKEVLAYREPVDINALLEGVTLESLQKVLEAVLKRRADRIDPVRSRFG